MSCDTWKSKPRFNVADRISDIETARSTYATLFELFSCRSLRIDFSQDFYRLAKKLIVSIIAESCNMFEWYGVVVLLTSGMTLALTFWCFFVPMNRVRSVEEVGFSHFKGSRKKMWINRARKNRKVGNCPPAFPNGWYVVAECREVRNKICKNIFYCGNETPWFTRELQVAIVGKTCRKVAVTAEFAISCRMLNKLIAFCC